AVRVRVVQLHPALAAAEQLDPLTGGADLRVRGWERVEEDRGARVEGVVLGPAMVHVHAGEPVPEDEAHAVNVGAARARPPDRPRQWGQRTATCHVRPGRSGWMTSTTGATERETISTAALTGLPPRRSCGGGGIRARPGRSRPPRGSGEGRPSA